MTELALFDYAHLDAETRIVVQQRTEEIRTLVRRTAQDIIDIGNKLIEVKARLGHGNFGEWLNAEFGWKHVTASHFINVALRFKSSIIEDLHISPTVLYMLSAPSVSDDVREEAIAIAERGETLKVAEAKSLIASYRLPENMPHYLYHAVQEGRIGTKQAVAVYDALQSVGDDIAQKCIENGVTDAQAIRLLQAKRHTDTAQSVLASGYIQTGDDEDTKPLSEVTAWDLQGALRKAEKEHNRAAIDLRIEAKMADIEHAPQEVFSVVYADPAWQYDNSGLYGAAERHYPTMLTNDICTLPDRIGLQIADTAVLFLWATNPLLTDAMKVISAWGFEYKTNIVWVKDKATTGLGFYVRGQHELLMIATRGNFQPSFRPVSTIVEPKAQHSQKPALVYSLIETMYPKQHYVELFARDTAPRNAWAFWGVERGEHHVAV